MLRHRVRQLLMLECRRRKRSHLSHPRHIAARPAVARQGDRYNCRLRSPLQETVRGCQSRERRVSAISRRRSTVHSDALCRSAVSTPTRRRRRRRRRSIAGVRTCASRRLIATSSATSRVLGGRATSRAGCRRRRRDCSAAPCRCTAAWRSCRAPCVRQVPATTPHTSPTSASGSVCRPATSG